MTLLERLKIRAAIECLEGVTAGMRGQLEAQGGTAVQAGGGPALPVALVAGVAVLGALVYFRGPRKRRR